MILLVLGTRPTISLPTKARFNFYPRGSYLLLLLYLEMVKPDDFLSIMRKKRDLLSPLSWNGMEWNGILFE